MKYTRKQMTEAIRYWQKKLDKMILQENTGIEALVMPDLTDGKAKKEFINILDKVFGGDAYAECVKPDEEQVVEVECPALDNREAPSIEKYTVTNDEI